MNHQAIRTSFRPHLAAALLLIPAAAALSVQPARAQGWQSQQVQQRVQPAAPLQVERFVVRIDGRIQPGEELRFRLNGTPGADAWVDVPGVIQGLDLEETRPGHYEARYTVRRRDDANAFARATATLVEGRQRVTARVEVRDRDDDPRRDDRAPVISDVSPDQGQRVSERGRTRLTAKLSDQGTGIDPASIRLRMDGRDVTADARLDRDEVQYRDNLQPGRHTADLTVRDKAGNVTRKTWTFTVVEDGRPREAALGLQLTTPADYAVFDAHGRMLLEGQTRPNATVHVRVDSVTSLGGVLGLTQAVADQTVQADGRGVFRIAVSPRTPLLPEARIDVRLTATSGGESTDEFLTLRQRRG
jgi:hypothetical protein